MAIVINSLTPENPTIPAGQSISFTVNATETNGETLSYLWEFSSDNGVTYTSSGLTNNTSTSYQTSNLSLANNGLYFRVRIENQSGDVVYSNEDSTIGDRIVAVTSAPSIIIVNEYDPSYTTGVASDIDLTVISTLINADISNTSTLSGMSFQWQLSSDGGTTWINVNDGDSTGTTDYVVAATTTVQISTSPVAYAKQTTLTIQGTSFGINNYRYRVVITDASASNSPVNLTETVIVINPIITIYSHPGDSPTDTDSTNCYKTSISNSGKLEVSTGALTTAGGSLDYTWEFRFQDGNGIESDWFEIDDGIAKFYFSVPVGYTANSSVLKLEKCIFFERLDFRCVLAGFNQEVPVTTNTHSVLFTDVVVLPSDISDVSILEDYYGDIVNRSAFTNYPVQSTQYASTLDCNRNTGLNGTTTMVFERQNPGSTTWNEVGITVKSYQNYDVYTPTPNLNAPNVVLENIYETPPVRIDLDNGAKYRVKVTSTAIYTLVGGTKVLTPIYSQSESILTVTRQIFITTQPANAGIYPNQNASFAISATTSSPATLTYQWQYNTSNTSTGWVNIDASNAGTIYSGYTTVQLILNQVPLNITQKFYRCVVNATGALASVTSSVAQLVLSQDTFTTLSNLNDVFVDEFQTATWTIIAQSASLGTVLYQWQKSTNYDPLNPSAATWTDISGATASTYQILSVNSPADDGYYRCQVTSAGGYVDYSNASELRINAVEIQILKDLASSITVLEGLQAATTLSVNAIATIGDAPTYQWQFSDDNGVTWTSFSTGYQGQVSSAKDFTPNPFSRSEDGKLIRCRIDAASVPNEVYSTVATLTVNRRFTYFADSAIKNVSDGKLFSLNLNPSVTGGTPTYQWYKNNTVMPGETASSLSFTASSSDDGNKYKCLINLSDCTQHRYSRNNADNIVSATASTYTVDVELNIVATSSIGTGNASSYTTEGIKTGAAIGTVICVPKPPGYVNNVSANTDDISQWEVAESGDPTTSSSASSVVSSGTTYNANKPSWVTDTGYRAPKWVNDRFPGYIELRGQWLKKKEFAALYRVVGDAYGVTTDEFRLPNPYGKKLMGTGNVDNNSGSVSIDPIYQPDGTSGGDKNVPGSMGGVWNYVESKQLPPGSPGVNTVPDGTAGSPDPSTFTLGSFSTSGFPDVEGIATTAFSGNYKFTVGPLLDWAFGAVPEHSHFGIAAGYETGFDAASGGCWTIKTISPNFYAIESDGGSILSGPEGIGSTDGGITHGHGLSNTAVDAGNGASANHSTGKGDTTAADSWSQTLALPNSPGAAASSFNITIEPAPANLTNAAKGVFDSALKFTLRNNKPLPLLSSYFRLKYLIKAY